MCFDEPNKGDGTTALVTNGRAGSPSEDDSTTVLSSPTDGEPMIATRSRTIANNTGTKKDGSTNISSHSIVESQEPPNTNAHDQEQWRKNTPDNFSWSAETEPHARRRKQILEKHPEIKQLYKPDPLSGLFCLGTVAVQIVTAYLVRDASWPVILVCAYVISGTMNHSLVLAMHELSHDLWFPKRWMNVAFSFFINCPNCVASAATFKRYHLEHHSFQGSDYWDADIPTRLEGKLFRYTATKLLWVIFQPLFYAFRPMIMKPKPITMMEIYNWMVVGAFDFLILHFWGHKALAYLFLGSILGLGLHPMAGHFIAEHFEFIEGQETYSYYGPLNVFAYNVGYHNEHHDFPKVPGRLLPQVKKMAPEFYDDLPHYDFWTQVLIGFILGRNINCFCRVKRKP